MEDRGVVGPDEDPVERGRPGQPPISRRFVITLEQEARRGDAQTDRRPGQDGLEPGLIQPRRHVPGGGAKLEAPGHAADRGHGAGREERGQGQRQDDFDQSESLPARTPQYSLQARTFRAKKASCGWAVSGEFAGHSPPAARSSP